MPENMIKEMLKTPGRYAFEVDKNLKVRVLDLDRTYSFKVDKEHNTKEVYDNGVKMNKTPVQKPDKHEPRKPEDMPGLPAELGVGCVGLGMLVENSDADECVFRWGKWF